jgi:dihydropteroate synthase
MDDRPTLKDKESKITPEMIEAGAEIILDVLGHDPFMSPTLAEEIAEKILRGRALSVRK